MNANIAKYNFIPILISFFANPFLTILYIFGRLRNANYNRWYPCLVSLFFGLLAYTQYAPNADINRSYHSMIAIGDFNSQELLMFLALDKYKLYTILNYVIYQITGNVQITSLIWGSSIYLFIFFALENLSKYYGASNHRYMFPSYLATIFCFVIFVEAMETIKQAVGFSLFLYSFSLFLLNERKKAIVIFLVSLGVHMSQLFLLPLVLCKTIKTKYLLLLTVLSFAFRTFNLMLLVNSLAGILGLDVLSLLAEGYVDQSFDNFSSSAPYFQLTYGVLLSFVIIHGVLLNKKDPMVTNLTLIFIIILNLNYSNNHNYTRLLLHSFPIWIMIYMSFMHNIRSIITKRHVVCAMLFLTFMLQAWFSIGRFGTDESEYQCSFMGNSIVNIVTSSIFGYLTYDVPVN